jgi:hypothetical protein
MLKTKSDFIEYLATKGITLAVANDCWLEYLAEGPDGDQQLRLTYTAVLLIQSK